jgi:hypothetical protein
MTKLAASDPVLIDTRSHSVSLGYRRSLEKEEFFPNFTAVWRGKAYHVDMEASRYAFSDGTLSEWRIFARHIREGYTELARMALGDACKPLVLAWLDSDTYKVSRAQAFARQIASTLREERYSTHRTHELLDAHFSELTDEDSARLHKAADILDQFLVLVQA